MSEPLAILAACAHEARLVRTCLTAVQHPTATQAGRLWHGRLSTQQILLMQCGIGPQRVTQAVTWLVEHYALSGLLSVGFAGGLQPELTTGDGLLVTAVHEQCQTMAKASSTALQPDPRLGHIAAMALAQSAVLGHTGSLISLPALLWQATAKQHLGQHTGALAADMESYRLGQMARQYRLPFAIVRTIFDPATEDLTFPVEPCMTSTGDLQAGRLGHYLLQHPLLMRELPHWWWQSRTAGRQLQRWVKHFFILLCQGA